MAASTSTIGVVLLNLGGPERLSEVRPFLFNLFSDRRIIRLGPAFLQKPLAWWIAKRRAPKSSKAYALIGGGSPLLQITRAQGEKLAVVLQPSGPFAVFVAMRYWRPYTDETLDQMERAGISRIIALTLYPHFSAATTGSSLTELHAVATARGLAVDIVEVRSWPRHPGYIACLTRSIEQGLARFGKEPVTVVYSAHSLPVKLIEAGDPYLEEIKETISAVEAKLGRKGRLCFQSRSGPVQWLAPSTPDMLKDLAAAGCRNVLMVPISFVSDHVETLYEIDIQYRDLAKDLGMRLERAESLNTRPEFIETLADLVRGAAESKGWLPAG